jgi:topoisomerase-4 subunit B
MAEELDFNEVDNSQEQSDFGGYQKLVHKEPLEHIRLRPGMYIGKLGDGSQSDDGIYVLLKEVLDNAIDEYAAGYGNTIDIDVSDGRVSIRDYGRGIPLEQVKEAASEMNTSGKFDTENYKSSVGLNGVGMKAANALADNFFVQSVRDGMTASASFERGHLVGESGVVPASEGVANGTLVQFKPDSTIFKNYEFHDDFVETMIKNYSFLNTGLTLIYNGKKYHSRNGLSDLVNEYMTNDPLVSADTFAGR